MTKFRQPTGSAPKRPAGSAHACRSSSCSHRCGQVAPAPCGYRLRPPASAWQTNAARVRRDFFAIPAGRTATPSALPTPLSCTWCRRCTPLRVSLPMLLDGKTHYLSQRPPTCWITRRMIFALLTPCPLRPFDLLEGDAPSAPTFAAEPHLFAFRKLEFGSERFDIRAADSSAQEFREFCWIIDVSNLLAKTFGN